MPSGISAESPDREQMPAFVNGRRAQRGERDSRRFKGYHNKYQYCGQKPDLKKPVAHVTPGALRFMPEYAAK